MGALIISARNQARTVVVSPRLLATAGIVLGAVTLFTIGLVAGRPITFPDEVIYGDSVRNLAAGHGLEVAGTPLSAWTYGPLYLLLIAPVYRVAPSLHTAYLAARGVNCLFFVSAAVPIYLVARRFVSKRSAWMVAAGGVALPSSVYTTKLQTESLSYPATMWVVLGVLSVLAVPTARRQLVLLGLLAAVPLTRFELIALTPASLATCLLCASGTIGVRLRSLRTLLVGLAFAGVGLTAVLVGSAAKGGDDSHGLTIHLISARTMAAQVGSLVAAFDLATGVVPFAVLLGAVLLLLRSPHWSWVGGEVRTLVILTTSLLASLATFGGIYLAGLGPAWRPSAPPDRYVFYAVPLTFLVMAIWIERGTQVTNSLRVAAVAAAPLPVLAGTTQVHGKGLAATGGALSYMPWTFIRALSPEGWWLVLLGVYCAGGALLLTGKSVARRRVRRYVVGSVAVCTLCAFTYVALGSLNARVHSPPPGWLDARSNGTVIGIWVARPTDRQAFAMWEVHATNENLQRVYYLRQPDRLGPERKIAETPDGRLIEDGSPIVARYVMTAASTRVVGRLVGRSHGLALYKVRQPVRLANVSD